MSGIDVTTTERLSALAPPGSPELDRALLVAASCAEASAAAAEASLAMVEAQIDLFGARLSALRALATAAGAMRPPAPEAPREHALIDDVTRARAQRLLKRAGFVRVGS